MADQNQDGKGMISSGTQPGPGERLRDDMPQGTGGQASTASSAAGSSGGVGADYVGGASTAHSAGPMGSDARENASRLASGARQYADDMASRAKEKGRSMFDQQKDTAVGQVNNVASAIRSTASQLQGEGQDQIARYIGMMADQLEGLGGRLREKDLDTLFADAQNLARRAPGTFFVGSVAVGFLLARFLKSSSTSGVEYRGYSGARDDDWRSADATSSGAYMGSTAGSAAGGMTGGGTTAGSVGSVGSGGAPTGSGVGADGTPGSSGTKIGGSSTPMNGSGAGGPSI